MDILKAIIATILYILVLELAGFWIDLEEYFNSSKLTIHYYFLIQGAIQFIIVVCFIQFFTKTSLTKLPQKTTLSWYLLALLLGGTYLFIQFPLLHLIGIFFDLNINFVFDFDRIEIITNINFISTIILVPISEELFFRQYLQRILTDKHKPIFAILFTSILFALCHAPYMNLILESVKSTWNQSYITFFGGLITGYLFYKSKSIGPPILMHISWNFMVSIV